MTKEGGEKKRGRHKSNKDSSLLLEQEKDFFKDKAVAALDLIISELMQKYSLSYKDVIQLLKKREKEKEEDSIPPELFRDRSLGILETIIKFLKEEKGMSFHKIAETLNRDDRTIWAAYHSAIKKNKKKLRPKPSKYSVPFHVFRKRKLGPLEALTLFLRDKCSLGYNEIAKLINRDNRTIWITYNRAKKKVEATI